MTTSVSASRVSVHETAKVAIIASLYVAVTVVLAVISFGAVQLRLSEMFNYLALFHKRYIIAVTLGVVIANFLSPMWWVDVPLSIQVFAPISTSSSIVTEPSEGILYIF